MSHSFASHIVRFSTVLVIMLGTTTAFAEDCDDACQAARNAQDPLAPVRAIFTDNTISYGPTDSDTTYNYQIQPAYTIKGDAANVILRGVITIHGNPNGETTDWGIGDTVLQAFYVPNGQEGFKIGYGPQVSIKTRQEESFGGPGLGAGFALVGFGFAGDLAYGGILGHLWGEDDFSASTIQPIVYYNLDLFGGSYIGYNNSIVYNWKADGGQQWTVPLGLTAGKTFLLESGYAIDASLGAYSLVDAPDGSNDWQFKFGLSLFWP